MLSVSDHLAEWGGGLGQPWGRGCGRGRPEEEGVSEGRRLEGSEQGLVPVKSEKSKDWRHEVPRQAAWGRVLRYGGMIPGV